MKKLTPVGLSIMLALCSFTTVNATERNLKTEVKNQYKSTTLNDEKISFIKNFVSDTVKQSYSEHYDVNIIDVEILDVKTINNVDIADVQVNFEKTLKYNNASELPYIVVLEKELLELTDNEDILIARKYIDDLKQEMETEYIGVAQEENTLFKIQIPHNVNLKALRYDDINMKLVGIDDNTYSMEYFKPATYDELVSTGKNELNDIIDNTTIDYNYTNNEYDYKLALPSIFLEQGAVYTYKEFETGTLAKIVYEYSETDKESFIDTWLRLFEIRIYHKGDHTTDIKRNIKGDILAETDSFIYTFVDIFANIEIENTAQSELYKNFSSYYPKVKKSFSLIH